MGPSRTVNERGNQPREMGLRLCLRRNPSARPNKRLNNEEMVE